MPVMSSVVRPVDVIASASFEDASTAAIAELQRAFAELLNAIPGGVHRAVDIERGLGLNKKLAWQVFKVAQSEQPLAEAANVPTRPSMRRLLSAAADKRISSKVIRRTMEAFEKFEAFVNTHGGDREGFLALTSGLGLEGSKEADLRMRKALLRANAQAWGVQIGVSTRTFIIQRRPKSADLFDGILLSGYVGMQRLRAGAPMTLNAWVKFANDPAKGAHQDSGKAGSRTTSVSRPETRGLEVLSKFSSQPMPELLTRPGTDGNIETEIVFPVSGRAGAVTIYTSQSSSAGAVGEQSRYSLTPLTATPTEILIAEMLIPEGLSDPATASVAVYGRRGAVERVTERRTIDLLPQTETATYLGLREAVPPISEVPQHADAVREVLANVGWLGTKFDVYRCRVGYPILHTLICLDVGAMRRAGT